MGNGYHYLRNVFPTLFKRHQRTISHCLCASVPESYEAFVQRSSINEAFMQHSSIDEAPMQCSSTNEASMQSFMFMQRLGSAHTSSALCSKILVKVSLSTKVDHSKRDGAFCWLLRQTAITKIPDRDLVKVSLSTKVDHSKRDGAFCWLLRQTAITKIPDKDLVKVSLSTKVDHSKRDGAFCWLLNPADYPYHYLVWSGAG